MGELEVLNNVIQKPWIVGGDFNIIINDSEKLGGLDIASDEIIDFTQCLNNSILSKISFTGSSYTWWNGRIEEACIFKRLDRVLGNSQFQQHIPNFEVEHLIRDGLNHSPLLVKCHGYQYRITKPFKFLNFWVQHHNFKDLIKDN